MHECPTCGMACDCDGEDLWHDVTDPTECECECWIEDEIEMRAEIDDDPEGTP